MIASDNSCLQIAEMGGIPLDQAKIYLEMAGGSVEGALNLLVTCKLLKQLVIKSTCMFPMQFDSGAPAPGIFKICFLIYFA